MFACFLKKNTFWTFSGGCIHPMSNTRHIHISRYSPPHQFSKLKKHNNCSRSTTAHKVPNISPLKHHLNMACFKGKPNEQPLWTHAHVEKRRQVFDPCEPRHGSSAGVENKLSPTTVPSIAKLLGSLKLKCDFSLNRPS